MNDKGQLQLVEVITVAVLIFTALAVASVFRLPTSPGTFQEAELERLGSGALGILANTPPTQPDQCWGNDSPFQNGSQLELMLSMALGYIGPNSSAIICLNDSEEPALPSTLPLEQFFGQALPDGVRWVLYYSNGVNVTKVVPLHRNPPLLEVSVAHAFLAPNWTIFADHLSESVPVRVGERLGLGTPTEIRDPLNRTETEFGYDFLKLYEEDVPANATLGTHRVCYAADDCSYFTVTQPRIFGSGSQILPGDRDNSSTIRELGDFDQRVKYHDANSDTFFDMGDPLYLDVVDNSTTVSEGDLRLFLTNCGTFIEPATCDGGSTVTATDGDVGKALALLPPLAASWELRGADANGNGVLDIGEGVYVAERGDATLNQGERRLSRVGVYQMGTQYEIGDADPSTALDLAFTGTIRYADDNADGKLGPGEAVYLDLAGDGQVDGLEHGDFHLNPKGQPTVHYYYDVKLVVWFGI
jgi:hypothetical protein